MLELMVGISVTLHVGHALKIPQLLESFAKSQCWLTEEESEEVEAIEAAEMELEDSVKEIL